MARAWHDERLEVLLSALQGLGTEQEAEIEQLCTEELAAWRARPEIKEFGSLVPIMTATRNAIKNRIKVTPANRWQNPRTGKYEHIARKYMNFTPEEWDARNALSDKKFEERLKNQQLIKDPQEIVARAEQLLQSERWYDLVAGLAVTTGRRLTELLKEGRFFPKTAYTVVFDGQLKRRDIVPRPYEIPVLLRAELVIAAWRKLRSLEDCTDLSIKQVEQRYSKDASAAATMHFTGLIPLKHEHENLHTHGFRAVYAQLAVHFFCPKSKTDDTKMYEVLYANAILGQYQAKNERQMRDFLTTAHYFDYYVKGEQGTRLEEPGVEILEVFQGKEKAPMTTDTTTQEETQDQKSLLETRKAKSRGALTTKPGTQDQVIDLMHERHMLKHDEIIVDLMTNDAIAHQMYDLLKPLAPELAQDENSPLAILQALIAAYQVGSSPAMPGLSELVQGLVNKPLSIKVGEKPAEVEISSKENPVGYLTALTERDRRFKAGIDSRTSKVDVATASMEELRHKIKTAEAATERFRRAVDSIMRHNEQTEDYLHRWFINAAMIRKLVGGQNELVQAYIKTRKDEIDAHHDKFKLTSKANEKGQLTIEDDVSVS